MLFCLFTYSEDYYGKKGVPKKGDESLEGLEDESNDDESDEEAIQQVVKNQKSLSNTKKAVENSNEEKDL